MLQVDDSSMKNLKNYSRYVALSIIALGAGLYLNPNTAAASPGLIDGRDVRTNIDNLTRQVLWFSNLRDAQDSARQKNRPVLWVHMLGQIEGAT